MIIQIDLGDSIGKAQRLLSAIAEISTDADDILAPAIKEKSSKAAALITDVGLLLKGVQNNDVQPQLNKPDVSGQLPLTDAEIDAEAELRYPVQTHSTPDDSPYVGSKATFIHGVQWALQKMNGNCH